MKRASLVGLLVAAMLAAGCLVEVEKVEDPHAAFARARADVARVQGQPGRPEHLEALVYDRGDRQLIRASLPMGLVREMGQSDDLDFDLGDGESEAARRVRSRLRWADVEKAGRGILVEVEEEGGDQVLVWLR
jgi:hypothetical protein